MEDYRAHGLVSYTAGDAVTSLMYASVVNVILAQVILSARFPYLPGVFVILFVFIDWLGRIGVPQTFLPHSDQIRRRLPLTMLLKALLEIAAVFFFLLASCKVFFPSAQLAGDIGNAAQFYFSLFLLASFVWNCLVLWVMTNLQYFPLLWASLCGCVLDLDGAINYTQGFKSYLVSVRSDLSRAPNDKRIYRYLWAQARESSGRTIGQLLGHHITWVNLFWGVVLLMDLRGFFGFFGLGSMVENVVVARLVGGLMLLVIPTILYFIGFAGVSDIREASGRTKIFRTIAGLSSAILLVVFYSLWTIESVLYLIVIQHAFFGVFLQFAINVPQIQDQKKD